ncbi:MAG: YfiR family protein [Candidatus Hydrogenedentes bacterium]|nr:YfiR family protein [Candidatus Hydrogenedentota bacterium]
MQLAGICVGLMCIIPVIAEQYSEYEVKAAFLIKFTKFVDWPEKKPDPNSAEAGNKRPFLIGVLGEDHFQGALDKLAEAGTVDDRPMQVKRAAEVDPLLECQMLFISASEEEHLEDILKATKGRGILTVSDAKNFFDYGGMIQLMLEENRIQFRIDDDAAEAEGLKLSSQLLQLAKEVKHSREGGGSRQQGGAGKPEQTQP